MLLTWSLSLFTLVPSFDLSTFMLHQIRKSCWREKSIVWTLLRFFHTAFVLYKTIVKWTCKFYPAKNNNTHFSLIILSARQTVWCLNFKNSIALVSLHFDEFCNDVVHFWSIFRLGIHLYTWLFLFVHPFICVS